MSSKELNLSSCFAWLYGGHSQDLMNIARLFAKSGFEVMISDLPLRAKTFGVSTSSVSKAAQNLWNSVLSFSSELRPIVLCGILWMVRLL